MYLYTWLFLCDHPYLFSLLFCCSAIPTSCCILKAFYYLFMSLLLAAGACMHAWAEFYHLSQSSKFVLTGFLSRCMQYWLNHWPGSVQIASQQWMTKTLPVSMQTNHISNSAIVGNIYIYSYSYVLLLSDCMHAYKWQKYHHKWSHIVLELLVWSTLWDF